ncbi:MAG TPA: response regulator [Tepidisphaeraceae bacterium]|jgi:DNA-binding response OmpR family regulator|nr:response regulator [Tepidisphaeraceae bacterium]
MDQTTAQESGLSRAARILLCDDSASERSVLGLFLRRAGYTVDEVPDGDAALLHLKNRQVDLLLLDLHMPQKDGFGVLSYVQEHRRSLPVILLSGMSPDDIQHKMHYLKSQELPPLLIKPIDPERLLEIMELHLAGELPTIPEQVEDAHRSDQV